VITVGVDSDKLTAAIGGREPTPFQFVGGTTFERGNSRITFVMEAGVVDRVLVDQVSGLYVLIPETP
jgi:hypothetical protein